MDSLADYKRKSNKKSCIQDFPEGILDVIEMYYPEKYSLMVEGWTSISTLFSQEEWLDILTKSRNSFKDHLQRVYLSRKYS